MRGHHHALVALTFLLTACGTGNPERVVDTWEDSEQPREVRTETADQGGEEVQQYHENGRIHTRGKLVDGVREGTWNTYREDGLPWSQVTYASGKKQGPFRTWHPGGIPHIEGQHVDDRPSGTWRFYAKNGQLVETLNYDGAN